MTFIPPPFHGTITSTVNETDTRELLILRRLRRAVIAWSNAMHDPETTRRALLARERDIRTVLVESDEAGL